MKVLIGTTNPAKVNRFKELLLGFDIDYITLKDLNIISEPNETGKTPADNAKIKALYYSQFFDVVICNDSGLYFEELDIEDKNQPGLNIRTPNGLNRLNDEEMVSYYSNLIKTLGGKVSAYYLDGIAVYYKGIVNIFVDPDFCKTDSFYMVDKPSKERRNGWPLDSLSIIKENGKYFLEYDLSESKDNIFIGNYKKRIINFLVESLGLK